MNRQQQDIEQEIFEALDRVAQGETTVDDAKLLAAASGVKWKLNEPKPASMD